MPTKAKRSLPAPSNEEKKYVRNEWFGAMLHNFTLDREHLNQEIASPETTQFYEKIIFGDPHEFMLDVREQTTKKLIEKLVVDYFNELKNEKVSPLKLYLDHNNSTLLVWAEIEDDDEGTEKGLLTAEAKANAKNYKYGFHISSTIIEKSDNFPVPPHYKNVLA